MPFEIAPKETQVEVGPFEKDAALMLQGCAVLLPHKRTWVDDEHNPVAACALGAWLFAKHNWTGGSLCDGAQAYADLRRLQKTYFAKYGTEIAQDNDSGAFTREQIAARIAALR